MTAPHDVDRDPQLQALLRSTVDAPPLRPGFHDELESRLAEAGADYDTRVTGIPAHRHTRTTRRLLAAGAVAVAAAAVILAVIVLPAVRGTDTATAADMLASMDSPSGGAHVVRLFFTEGIAEGSQSAAPVSPRANEQLTLSTSGDVRYSNSGSRGPAGDDSVTSSETQTYDERRHEARQLVTLTPDDGAGVLVIERPSWGSSIMEVSTFANFMALADSLRAWLAEGDPNAPVGETTYLGRPAWHADLTERMPGSDSSSPGGVLIKWSVTVDKATGLLLASDFGSGPGRQVFRVTRLEVDPKLPQGWQSIPKTGQKSIAIEDEGTRFGSPEAVARRSWPTLVLVPRWTPAGYRMTDVATTDFMGMMTSAKDESRLIYLSRHDPREYYRRMTSIDASVQRVMVRYRRGFSSFVVEIRPLLRGDNTPRHFKAGRLSGEDVTLSAGYLKGEHARTYIAPYLGQGPTLITYSDRSMITITGDLTRQELIDVADSLKAYGDVGKPLPPGYGY
jgi:hypothetical protein